MAHEEVLERLGQQEEAVRRAGEEHSWLWRSDGRSGFTIEPMAEAAPRGTSVVLKLRDDAKEFLDEWRLRVVSGIPAGYGRARRFDPGVELATHPIAFGRHRRSQVTCLADVLANVVEFHTS